MQGFWARLTLHDPEPSGDVERGWHSKLASLQHLAAWLMARTGLDRLSPAALAVVQHSALCTLPILGLALVMGRLQQRNGSITARAGLHR